MTKLPATKRRKTSLTQPWQLQVAKARFSELFRKARAEGPQWVTRQGKDAVVVLAAEEFQRLSVRSRQPESLVEFFAKSPLAGADLNLERTPDYGRPIDL
jgi:antitoxin Phd